MIAPQKPFYTQPQVWTLFDFRVPGTGARMRREAYSWKSSASIERIDEHHAILVVRPGGARRLAR